MDDLSRFCCLNSDCPDHGKRGAGNLTVTGRYGPGKARRMLRCRTCKARFSERKGTPLFDARLPAGEGRVGPGARRRGLRRPPDRPALPGGTATPSPATAAWPATTPRPPTTSSWPFPPRTTEVQFDEKWAFVAKKEANCDRADPADDHKGDYWDHVAFDPEHRLVVAVVPGARTIENTEALVEDFRRRTGGRLMNLMTSDDYPAYETAILHAYGETVTPPRTGKPGRPKAPYQVAAGRA